MEIPASKLIEIGQRLEVDMNLLLTGEEPRMRIFTVTRKGEGIEVERRIVQAKLDAALATIEAQQPHLDLPFKVPEPTLLAVLLPEENSKPETVATDGESGSF